MTRTPYPVTADNDILDVLRLIQDAFAYMEGRIHPPSSMQSLTAENRRAHCRSGEIWAVGKPLVACVVLTEKGNDLYVGKLAVGPNARHKGYARGLIAHAETRAKALGKLGLLLNVRIELTENHAAFEKMGFDQTGTGTPPGLSKPTYLIMRKPL